MISAFFMASCSSGSSPSSDLVKRYLDAMVAQRTDEAFGLTQLARGQDSGTGRLLGGGWFRAFVITHPLKGYELRQWTSDGSASGHGSVRLRYPDSDVTEAFRVSQGVVQVNIEELAIHPRGPAIGLRLDGVPVDVPITSSCGMICLVNEYDISIVHGPHTLSLDAGPWTSALTQEIPAKDCESSCPKQDTSPAPALNDRVAPAGRAVFGKWLGACERAAFVCAPPICFPLPDQGRPSIQLGGPPRLPDQVATDAWQVSFPATRTCPGHAAETVTVSITYPMKGDPVLGDVSN
jgi:hypothetical protein